MHCIRFFPSSADTARSWNRATKEFASLSRESIPPQRRAFPRACILHAPDLGRGPTRWKINRACLFTVPATFLSAAARPAQASAPVRARALPPRKYVLHTVRARCVQCRTKKTVNARGTLSLRSRPLRRASNAKRKEKIRQRGGNYDVVFLLIIFAYLYLIPIPILFYFRDPAALKSKKHRVNVQGKSTPFSLRLFLSLRRYRENNKGLVSDDDPW